jgi:hypothetical protein
MTEEQQKVDQYNDLMSKMSHEKEKWQNDDDDDDDDDDTDRLLSNAIDLAIQQGKGWGPGEKRAYLDKILDDDFIPPLFATSVQDLERSGLQEAFTSLVYDGESPVSLMWQFRKKGNDAFANGKRNQVKNMQYYRDAINHYYEAYAWACKIQSMMEGDLAQADTDDPTYNERELREEKASICANLALAHMQLKNWGFVRDECKKAVLFNEQNVKAWFRLAKAYQNLQDYELAGEAIESGLAIESANKELLKLQTQLTEKIRKARLRRQQRERARAERTLRVKAVWKHCASSSNSPDGKIIRLGRVPLVTTVADDEEDDDEFIESRWHDHLPHSGQLPAPMANGECWAWPCILIYPSHNQSDFIANFGENEMVALRLAHVFPELEDPSDQTTMPWDRNNEFVCSNLAVYFEVYNTVDDDTVHPENVELLRDQATTMRFYEASRALKGDEGTEMVNVARAVARKHLYAQRKAWKKKHGSLWSKPDPNTVVRVHPAMTLRQVLVDSRMVVPNVSTVVAGYRNSGLI